MKSYYDDISHAMSKIFCHVILLYILLQCNILVTYACVCILTELHVFVLEKAFCFEKAFPPQASSRQVQTDRGHYFRFPFYCIGVGLASIATLACATQFPPEFSNAQQPWKQPRSKTSYPPFPFPRFLFLLANNLIGKQSNL